VKNAKLFTNLHLHKNIYKNSIGVTIMKKVLFTLSSSLLLFAALSMTSCDNIDSTGKYVVDSSATGAAFNRIEDVDGDGLKDIVLSQFGTQPAYQGEVAIYYNKTYGIPKYYDFQKKVLFDVNENVCFPNETTIYDIDNDGDMDIFTPSGFIPCTLPFATSDYGFVWFEQKNNKWMRHDLVAYGQKLSGEAHQLFFHKAEIADIDQDGIMDLVTVGEIFLPPNPAQGQFAPVAVAKTFWFKGNNSNDRFESTPYLIGNAGGGLPSTYDVDNDGDLDIISAQYFGFFKTPGSFIWFENNGTDSNWPLHIINGPMFGPSIQFSVIENLFGDGVDRFIGANHVNTNPLNPPSGPPPPAGLHEAVYLLNSPLPNGFWPFSVLTNIMQSRPNSDGSLQLAPGVFDSGDIDGDGDIDIVVSGDGDPNIYVIEQVSPGSFETVILDSNMGQAGVSVGDLNDDGIDEIVVSSFDQNTIAIYNYETYMDYKNSAK